MERNIANGQNIERERHTRRILILEAHLDDFEIGMSAWLAKMAGYPTEITLVTFCGGRRTDKTADINKRSDYRESNLDKFKKLYPNVTINNLQLSYGDTELDAQSIGKIIEHFYSSIKTYDSTSFNPGKYKEIYINQADLHADHKIVNQIGKILTRQYKGKVFEFIIANSGYFSEESLYNTVIRAEYKFNVESYSEKYIYPCLFPTEKTSLQQILYGQKGYDGKFITDKFNLIKDVFVVGD